MGCQPDPYYQPPVSGYPPFSEPNPLYHYRALLRTNGESSRSTPLCRYSHNSLSCAKLHSISETGESLPMDGAKLHAIVEQTLDDVLAEAFTR